MDPRSKSRARLLSSSKRVRSIAHFALSVRGSPRWSSRSREARSRMPCRAAASAPDRRGTARRQARPRRQGGVLAERGRDDPDEVARGRSASRSSSSRCRREREEPPEQATEDDEPRVEHVDPAGKAAPVQRPTARARPARPGRRRGVPEDGLDLGAAAVGRPAGPPEQGGSPRPRSPSSRPSRSARTPDRVDREVADLPAVAGDAGQRPAVDDDPATDADLAREKRTWSAPRAAPRSASASDAEVGLVRDRQRNPEVERVASRSPSGTSRQPRFGAIETSPSVRRTTPAIATPTPMRASAAPDPART